MSIARGWRRIFRLRSVEREVDDEIAFHLEMREQTLRGLGVSDAGAKAAALERFGDAAKVRDACVDIDRQHERETRMIEWIESVASDFRYALRSLRKAPAFATAACLTLALGIGATSAMFSLVDGILLRPLPFAQPDRLVQFLQAYPEKGLDHWVLSQENLAMYRDGVRELQSFAGYQRRGATLTADGRAERINTVRVTGDFFTTLGVAPALGSVFGRAEDVPGATNVAVLAHGFWQARFGGDRSIVGKSIVLDGEAVRVIGVMPDGFIFPRADAQLFMPLGLDPTQRFGWFLTGVGRLAPGATVEQARSASTAVMRQWSRTQPGLLGAGTDPAKTRMTTLVTPLREAMIGDTKRSLEILQAAVVLILLIAVANVATLLSSRSAARSREVALRSALGASRGRVLRQLLTESVALATLGGAAGIGLAYLLVNVVTKSSAVSLPRLYEVSVNGKVLLFTLLVAVASGIAFGLAPALSLVRHEIGEGMAGGTKASARGSARRFNNALVVMQLALSVVLLVSAGLVLKSFRNLLATRLGFDATNVTTVALPLPARKYSEPHVTADAAALIVERVRTIPGVQEAAIAWSAPFSGNKNFDGYIIEGHAPPGGSPFETQTVQVAVGPGYFGVLRIPLKCGRDFTAMDRDGMQKVTIVDEALAGRYWNGADAIGKRMRLTGDTSWLTIVGVVGSVRDDDVASAPVPHSYFPFAQVPDNRPVLIVRTGDDPAPALSAIRRTVAEMEPGVPLDNVRPLASWIDRTLDTRRLTEMLLTGFALLAATLAGVGIYGVMALYVSNRNREFGIRLAVGAEPRALVRLVMHEGLILGVTGVALGLVAALLSTRWLQSLLYDVSATDPTVYVTLAVALLAVAGASCFLPARRAAQSDPLAALRAE